MGLDLTIIIKTFERKKSLFKLLLSIERYFPNVSVVIADDSLNGLEQELKRFVKLNITYLKLPFDTGLSFGRNEALKAVKTQYFLLCDDDFEFDERARVKEVLEDIQKHQYDIIGGDFYNYTTIGNFRTLVRFLLKEPKKFYTILSKKFSVSRYIGFFNIKSDDECNLELSNLPQTNYLTICHMVNNFFVANTKSIQLIGGWDANLKLGEHEDFFYRAYKANLKVYYCNLFGTKHFPVITSNYKAYRLRSLGFKMQFAKIHGFKNYKEILKDNNTVQFEISE
jgi:glycosyltransferase involved in cell wall biosynthesis